MDRLEIACFVGSALSSRVELSPPVNVYPLDHRWLCLRGLNSPPPVNVYPLDHRWHLCERQSLTHVHNADLHDPPKYFCKG